MPRRYRRTYRAPRPQRRKFEWARVTGFEPPESANLRIDLLAPWETRTEQQTFDSTVVRIRGWILPLFQEGTAGSPSGVFSMMINQDDEVLDPADPNLNPLLHPDWDWMAWLPWAATGSAGTLDQQLATTNVQANPWAVDIKSSRKIESSGESLFLYRSPTPAIGLWYNLSVGLKLH